jgi:excisionase family DNA binding protein
MPNQKLIEEEEMTGPNSELMILSEVADYLGMAERTIYQYAQEGRIPAFKIGTSWRFRRSEIDGWLESQRTGPPVNEPLFPASEPPLTRRERRDRDKAEHEAEVEGCRAYIESVLGQVDRDTVEVAEIEKRFDRKVVADAMDYLIKDKRAKIDELTVRGEKVRMIRRG